MKILHTADWHIGKKLHGQDLAQDLDLFFDWMIKLIQKEDIKVLLVSGDIFDHSNPSNEAKNQYFKVLANLIACNCKVIVTGGNHDSPLELNAPAEILKILDIHVVGRVPKKLEDCLINIENKLIVAAIPYIRDADLRQDWSQWDQSNYQESVRGGIANIYQQLSLLCQKQYPHTAAIAMGHLYATGASTTESEREIQIGNLAGVEAHHFGDYFQYVALGHIHRPQMVGKTEFIQYSGSPIPLSFSEKNDQKRVLMLDFKEGQPPAIQSISIPESRKLQLIAGNLDQVIEKLTVLKARTEINALPGFIEVVVKEDKYNPQAILQLQQVVAEFQSDNWQILKHRIEFQEKIKGLEEAPEGKTLDELQPGEVFTRLLERSQISDQDRELVMEAFNELYQEIQQADKDI